jgi:hypothetical protein
MSTRTPTWITSTELELHQPTEGKRDFVSSSPSLSSDFQGDRTLHCHGDWEKHSSWLRNFDI